MLTAPDQKRVVLEDPAAPAAQGPFVVSVTTRTIVLFIAAALASLLALALVYAARTVLVQLTVAIVLAMAIEPVVEAFERRGARRGVAVGLSFGLVAVALAGFAYVLFAPLVDETRRLVDDAPSLVQQLTSGDGRLGFLEHRFHVVERTRSAVASHQLPGVATHAMSIVASAVQTGGAIVFVAFLTLFVQLAGRQWFGALVDLAPERDRMRIRRVGRGISGAVGGYVAGNLLISVVAGTVTTLVLVATSVPYAIPLGLIVAVFDLIPLVGATIGTVIVAAVALTQGLSTAVIVVAAMFLYQQVENHSLQQLVYHRTVKLSPLAIAVSVAAGAEVGGVVGALLGIPFAGALKVVGREVVAWQRGADAPGPDASFPQTLGARSDARRANDANHGPEATPGRRATRKGDRDMSNDDLVESVGDELRWDPRIDSASIAVAADDGVVTLRGTVGTYREKREANKAAERVYAVRRVENELQVRLMTNGARKDADLRGDILRALALDALVPSTVDAKVENGYVTLTGNADWQYQREEAEFVAANIRGVADVWDDIELRPPTPDAGDVEHAIKSAFERNAKLDAKGLSVTTSSGTVKLEGTVSSWSEHDDAVAAAWAAPGVRVVYDRLAVGP